MRVFKNNQRGFTLMEVLLVVAVISIIVAVGAPLYISMQSRNELSIATSTLVQDLYQAQSNTRHGNHACQWGVATQSHTITLFCGSSFANRNAAYDDIYVANDSITFSGLAETVYTKPYGLPNSTGKFNLNQNGSTSSVSINFLGMVDY